MFRKLIWNFINTLESQMTLNVIYKNKFCWYKYRLEVICYHDLVLILVMNQGQLLVEACGETHLSTFVHLSYH